MLKKDNKLSSPDNAYLEILIKSKIFFFLILPKLLTPSILSLSPTIITFSFFFNFSLINSI